MAKKIRKLKLASLIVVGEGPHDRAFLSHMKDLYDGRHTNQKVRIEAADGGSPSDILKTVIKHKQAAYDRKYVLMDSDVALSQQNRDYATKHKIIILQSQPVCLEGMLLEVLSQKAPVTNHACKAILHPQLSGFPTVKSSYTGLFTKVVLDQTAKVTIQSLRKILLNVK
ncbi:MAG: hypothetical protein ACI8WB_000318 [Phenylobacterium sp.]|jgi:hypothetical protein